MHVHFYTGLTVLGIHESKRPDVNLIFSTAIMPSTVTSPIKTLICDTKAVQIHQVDYNSHHDTFVLLCINNSMRNYLIFLSTVASNVGKLIKLLFYS